jgi:hypothetical protein
VLNWKATSYVESFESLFDLGTRGAEYAGVWSLCWRRKTIEQKEGKKDLHGASIWE